MKQPSGPDLCYARPSLQVFRKAGNGLSFLDRVRTELGLEVQLLSQEQVTAQHALGNRASCGAEGPQRVWWVWGVSQAMLA